VLDAVTIRGQARRRHAAATSTTNLAYNITVPTRYVVASGSSFGSKGDEQERIRTSLNQVVERNPNIKISAKVASNHGAILRKDAPAIAKAVREVAALDREG
jgi:hypothetical protein